MAAATTKGRQGAIRSAFGPIHEAILSSSETDKTKDKKKDKGTSSKTNRKRKSTKSDTETDNKRCQGYGI
jgi:hypothetical protein